MKNSIARIQTNRRIAEDLFEMKLLMPESAGQIRPGQFLNIRLQGLYLRRPISICDWDDDSITIIYKVIGKGTEQMSRMAAGESLDILWPLGNGFDLGPVTGEDRAGAEKRPVLIGGGAGVPPMYGLCRKLVEAGKIPAVVLGFRSEADAFYTEAFAGLGAEVLVATEDGSIGIKGFVTDALAGIREKMGGIYAYACGPEPMLRALHETLPAEAGGQMSFEERMGCGFGSCMGCSCRTKYGAKRICKDGPVLERSEIIW